MPEPSDDHGHGYTSSTASVKLVADYIGISVLDVYDLCITDYFDFLRDAVITSLDSHEKGREALQTAWRKEKFGDKADRDGLRALAGILEGR